MRRGTAAILGLWAATIVGGVAMVIALAALLAELGEGPALLFLFIVLMADAAAFSTVAVLIERQRPGNRIAWVLVAAGTLIVAAFCGFATGALRYVTAGGDDVVGGLFALLGASTLGPALFTAIPLLAILFPDGRTPGPRWRLPVAATLAAIFLSSLLGILRPGPVNADLPDNPLGIESPITSTLGVIAGPLLTIGIAGGAALAVAAVATRFRRSTGLEREQLKWLLAAVSAILLFLPLSFVDDNGPSGFSIVDGIAMASLALIPLSVGVAVTRYRLYEIDRIVSRTVGWALVSAALVAVFAGGVIALQALLAGVTENDTLVVAGSTLTVAALFQPLRGRVQRAVDRRFDRTRYDGQRTVDAFAGRLRDEVDLGQIREGTLATVGETVRPVHAAVWLRQEGAR